MITANPTIAVNHTVLGTGNYAVGRSALRRLTLGNGNVAIGTNAGAHLVHESAQCWLGPWRLPYEFAPMLRWVIRHFPRVAWFAAEHLIPAAPEPPTSH